MLAHGYNYQEIRRRLYRFKDEFFNFTAMYSIECFELGNTAEKRKFWNKLVRKRESYGSSFKHNSIAMDAIIEWPTEEA